MTLFFYLLSTILLVNAAPLKRATSSSLTTTALPSSATQTTLPVFVLTGTPPKKLTGTIADEVCDPTLTRDVGASITDLKGWAHAGLHVLNTPNVEKSPAYQHLFGNANHSEIIERFDAAEKLVSMKFTPITSLSQIPDKQRDLVFTCAAHAPGGFLVKTENAGINGAQFNAIRMTDLLLTNATHLTLSTAAAGYRNSTLTNVSKAFVEVNKRFIPSVGFVLQRESLKSIPLLGGKQPLVDQKLNGAPAFGFQAIQKLPADQKKLNPTNYAYIDLIAKTNRDLFFDTCTPNNAACKLPNNTCQICNKIGDGFPSDVFLPEETFA